METDTSLHDFMIFQALPLPQRSKGRTDLPHSQGPSKTDSVFPSHAVLHSLSLECRPPIWVPVHSATFAKPFNLLPLDSGLQKCSINTGSKLFSTRCLLAPSRMTAVYVCMYALDPV